MPRFTESSITLDFPDTNFFRFEACEGYTSLSGYHFKEMDACWYDVEQKTYWLFELKDFTSANLEHETINQKVVDLVKKAVDSWCMFLSVKHSYPYAISHINNCLPTPLPDDKTQFKFVTIIHCDNSQKVNVSLIHEKFRNRFKPYAELFGIKYYAVLEHTAAMRTIGGIIK